LQEKDNGKLIIKIDGRNLPMHPFVQRMIRKTLLAMLSTLKGTEIQGDESVQIVVKRAAA
jgi:hypothetical protein